MWCACVYVCACIHAVDRIDDHPYLNCGAVETNFTGEHDLSRVVCEAVAADILHVQGTAYTPACPFACRHARARARARTRACTYLHTYACTRSTLALSPQSPRACPYTCPYACPYTCPCTYLCIRPRAHLHACLCADRGICHLLPSPHLPQTPATVAGSTERAAPLLGPEWLHFCDCTSPMGLSKHLLASLQTVAGSLRRILGTTRRLYSYDLKRIMGQTSTDENFRPTPNTSINSWRRYDSLACVHDGWALGSD